MYALPLNPLGKFEFRMQRHEHNLLHSCCLTRLTQALCFVYTRDYIRVYILPCLTRTQMKYICVQILPKKAPLHVTRQPLDTLPWRRFIPKPTQKDHDDYEVMVQEARAQGRRAPFGLLFP